MMDFSDGKKTFYHKRRHDIGHLYCLVVGHSVYCGFHNETQTPFDHCRRCERYDTDRTMRSLNLWARWIIFRVNLHILLSNLRKPTK